MNSKRIKYLLTALLTIVSLVGVGHEVFAQDKEDAKITIEVTRTLEGGSTERFERSYNSQEEMDADEELRAFRESGDKQQVMLHINSDADFSYFFEDMEAPHLEIIEHAESLEALRELLDKDIMEKIPTFETEEGVFKIIAADGEVTEIDMENHEMMRERMEELHEELKMMNIDSEEFRAEMEVLREELSELHKEGSFVFMLDEDDPDHKSHRVVVLREVKVTLSDLDRDDEVASRMGLKNNKNLALKDLKTYPNPNEGKFTLEFQAERTEEPLEIRILDVAGKEVYYDVWNQAGQPYQNEIDLRRQGKGMYVLQIRQDDRTYNKKILIE